MDIYFENLNWVNGLIIRQVSWTGSISTQRSRQGKFLSNSKRALDRLNMSSIKFQETKFKYVSIAVRIIAFEGA